MPRRKILDGRFTHFSAPVQMMVHIGMLGGSATASELMESIGVTRSQVSKAGNTAKEYGWLETEDDSKYTGGRRETRYRITREGALKLNEMRMDLDRAITAYTRIQHRLRLAVSH